jgi:hypothetical protein
MKARRKSRPASTSRFEQALLAEGDSADERADDRPAEVVPRSQPIGHAHVLAAELADDVEDRAALVALQRERLLRSLEFVLEVALRGPLST